MVGSLYGSTIAMVWPAPLPMTLWGLIELMP